MKHTRIKYISAFFVLFLAAMFRLLLIWVVYYTFQHYSQTNDQKEALSKALNFSSISPPVVLFIEAICYLVFRKRYFVRRIVRLHLWMTIVSSFLFPIVQAIISTFIISSNRGAEEVAVAIRDYNFLMFYIGWILFALARILFIIAFVKSVPTLNEPIQSNEPSGFLDDFAQ